MVPVCILASEVFLYQKIIDLWALFMSRPMLFQNFKNKNNTSLSMQLYSLTNSHNKVNTIWHNIIVYFLAVQSHLKLTPLISHLFFSMEQHKTRREGPSNLQNGSWHAEIFLLGSLMSLAASLALAWVKKLLRNPCFSEKRFRPKLSHPALALLTCDTAL